MTVAAEMIGAQLVAHDEQDVADGGHAMFMAARRFMFASRFLGAAVHFFNPR